MSATTPLWTPRPARRSICSGASIRTENATVLRLGQNPTRLSAVVTRDADVMDALRVGADGFENGIDAVDDQGSFSLS